MNLLEYIPFLRRRGDSGQPVLLQRPVSHDWIEANVYRTIAECSGMDIEELSPHKKLGDIGYSPDNMCGLLAEIDEKLSIRLLDYGGISPTTMLEELVIYARQLVKARQESETWTWETVEKCIREIIATETEREIEKIKPDDRLEGDLGCDSLNRAVISDEVEKRFDMLVKDGDIRPDASVKELIEYVASRVAKSEAARKT